jgi:excisionase family DNA binding protein
VCGAERRHRRPEDDEEVAMGKLRRPRDPASSDPLLLTPEEAAEVLRVGRTTIYALMKAGDLHGIHIGRSCHLSRAELERYVRQMEAPDPAPPRPRVRKRIFVDQRELFGLDPRRRTPRDSTSSPPVSEDSRTLGVRLGAVRSS